jgi:hypothetical protein
VRLAARRPGLVVFAHRRTSAASCSDKDNT